MPTLPGKIPATLAVLTRNSAKTLARALESAKDFDDIVVCDGGSTDDTLAIAARYGARVIAQDKKYLDENGRLFDYGGAHNQALDASKYNWHFFLDSDEYLGSDAVAAVREIVEKRQDSGEGAFWVNRKYVINGTVIDHASTYPNRQMRFFSRKSALRFIKQVHERIKLKEGVVPEVLGGIMYIPFELDITAIRRKWDHQIAVQVQDAHISFTQFCLDVVGVAKVSTLWALRLVRNRLFYRGVHMPLAFEMERHRFHGKLLEALWSHVYIGKIKISEWISLPDCILTAVAAVITLVAATYRLSEAPGIWYDEGFFSQVALNLAEHGAQLIQVAPGQFVSSGTVTAGFTLYAPIAFMYKIFGVGVLQGRITMVFYICALAIVSYVFIRKLFGARAASLSALLIATFPLIYGNGKSILGEIPGLFYLISTFLALYKLERNRYRDLRLYALAGLLGGLSIITKPIYALLLPAGLIMVLFRARRLTLTIPGLIVAAALFCVPVIVWFHLQFGPGDTWSSITSFYVNPYDVIDYKTALVQGSLRFFRDATSLYTLLLMIVWSVSLFARRGKRMVTDVEVVAYCFCAAIIAASLRLPSWNRYIFPAGTIALMFASSALFTDFDYVATKLRRFSNFRWLVYALIVLLFCIQIYQLCFASFVAQAYESHRSRNVKAAFDALPPNASYFIYNVPEVVILLPTRNYYQFIMPHGDYEQVGPEQLPRIASHGVDYIVAGYSMYHAHPELFPGYVMLERVDRYAILTKS